MPGHNALELGRSSTTLLDIPASNGGGIDITRLPIAENSEDFVALVEGPESQLGWTAVVRAREDDIVFVLKDPRQLPLTMLWHSNGARTDFPWNGRNRGILGIEDGRAAGALGHAAALGDTVFSSLGIPTAFALETDRVHTVQHVIGTVPNIMGWASVDAISIAGDRLVLTGDEGSVLSLKFDARFFNR